MVEDEAHVFFDCPLYADLRADLAYDLQGACQPQLSEETESEAARALGGLLNPGCFTAARAVAMFAHRATLRRQEAFPPFSLEEACCGVPRQGRAGACFNPNWVEAAPWGSAVGVGDWPRAALGQWLGMDIPIPYPISLHRSALLGPLSPPALSGPGGDLGMWTWGFLVFIHSR